MLAQDHIRPLGSTDGRLMKTMMYKILNTHFPKASF